MRVLFKVGRATLNWFSHGTIQGWRYLYLNLYLIPKISKMTNKPTNNRKD